MKKLLFLSIALFALNCAASNGSTSRKFGSGRSQQLTLENLASQINILTRGQQELRTDITKLTAALKG